MLLSDDLAGLFINSLYAYYAFLLILPENTGLKITFISVRVDSNIFNVIRELTRSILHTFGLCSSQLELTRKFQRKSRVYSQYFAFLRPDHFAFRVNS